MERRSTLPVNEILVAERGERPWESAAVPGRWSHPSAADRGREVGDLDMAGLNIGAPTRLRRGGRALPPAGISTPLGGDSGELPRTYSGSSARADYRRRLELNAQDSNEDVLFRREMNYLERGAGGFSDPRRAGAGESRGSPPVQQPTSRSMRQHPRRAQREVGGGTETIRMRGPALAMRTRVEASTGRTRTRRSDCHPGEIKERARLPRRPWDSGWRRSRA